MATRVTRAGTRHVSGFVVFAFIALLVLSAFVSVFGGMLFLVPALLIVGPIGLAMWWVFHDRPPEDGRGG